MLNADFNRFIDEVAIAGKVRSHTCRGDTTDRTDDGMNGVISHCAV
jgi:hypothetical protein